MVYRIFGFDYQFDLNFFQLVFLCVLLGLFSKFLLSIISFEHFAKSNSQVLVFALLPTIGFVITSVISNNIALSLGMVGALSIVRFRTPIKHPSELVVYFYLITLGIVINVNPSIGINFSVFLGFLVVILEIYKKVFKKINLKEDFISNSNYFLRLELKKDIEKLRNSDNLVSQSFNNDSYLYILSFSSKEEADATISDINSKDLVSYNLEKTQQ